jgi:hypothetical protein
MGKRVGRTRLEKKRMNLKVGNGMEKLSEEEIRERLGKYPKIQRYFGSKILKEVRSCVSEKNVLTSSIEIENDVILKRVEDCLRSLENVKGFEKRIKHYQRNFQEVRSLIAELIEATYIRDKGCEIEFISETSEGTPDFKVNFNNRWIDFEIKSFAYDPKKCRSHGVIPIFDIKEGKIFLKGPLVKIRNKIKDAYRQLRSKEKNLKIIALYSYDVLIVRELINFELYIPLSDSSLINGIVFYSLPTKMRFYWENRNVSEEMSVPNLHCLLSDFQN